MVWITVQVSPKVPCVEGLISMAVLLSGAITLGDGHHCVVPSSLDLSVGRNSYGKDVIKALFNSDLTQSLSLCFLIAR